MDGALRLCIAIDMISAILFPEMRERALLDKRFMFAEFPTLAEYMRFS